MSEPSSSEKKSFGGHWCGPEQYVQNTPNLIAKYRAEENEDGVRVDVYCHPCPARFFTLKVYDECSGKLTHVLNTGSSQHELAAYVAEAIAEGMLGITSMECAPPCQD
jgi:hypothetical protein